MEKLIRPLLLILVVLFISSCEYLGFDGYINQLDDIGINSNLADAVSFNQHLASRPREFQGKVYVLGTRGVFELDADNLSDYTFYAYSQDLGYWEDYWQDELPPINCYRDPGSGNVIINSQNYDNGLKYGDTLTLKPDTQLAQYTSAGGTTYKFVAHSTQGGVKSYVQTYWYEPVTNYLYWTDTKDSGTSIDSRTFGEPELICVESISGLSDTTTIRLVTQTGIALQGSSAAQFAVYNFSSSWSTTVQTGVSVVTNEPVSHSYLWSSYYFSWNLYTTANDRYLLIWGEDFDDGESLAIYDYITGEEKVKTRIPGNNQFPELGESGKTVWVSSIRGGVAKYVY